MIPVPNLIAGILIGITNDTFIAKIIASAIWGLIFLLYINLARKDGEKTSIENFRTEKGKTKLGLSPKATFYFVEYVTGSITAIIFSLITGFIKNLF